MKYDSILHKDKQQRVLEICEQMGALKNSGETDLPEYRKLIKEREKLTEECIIMARSIRVGDPVWSWNSESFLICVREENFSDIGYVHYLSQDGKGFNWERWHDESLYGVSINTVYVEIHREKDNWSHGYVDVDSRWVTQIG